MQHGNESGAVVALRYSLTDSATLLSYRIAAEKIKSCRWVDGRAATAHDVHIAEIRRPCGRPYDAAG
jgi:hypothetical protein